MEFREVVDYLFPNVAPGTLLRFTLNSADDTVVPDLVRKGVATAFEHLPRTTRAAERRSRTYLIQTTGLFDAVGFAVRFSSALESVEIVSKVTTTIAALQDAGKLEEFGFLCADKEVTLTETEAVILGLKPGNRDAAIIDWHKGK